MQCPECQGEMWDNRESKRNPKQPDYKCKDKDCDKAVWLDKKKNGAKSSETAKPSGNGFQRSPETQARIERQHSQEMALRYLAIKGAIPEFTKFRELIDWFQRDVGHAPTAKQAAPLPAPRPEPETEPISSDGGGFDL